MIVCALISSNIPKLPLPAYNYLLGGLNENDVITLNGNEPSSLVIQEALYNAYKPDVLIYTNFFDCEYNIGGWMTEIVGEAEYFTDEEFDFHSEDVTEQLIEDSDTVFLIWNGYETEMLDAMELALLKHKGIILFNDKARTIQTINNIGDALKAVANAYSCF